MKWLLLIPLLGVSGWAWYERQALGDFPGILSAYSAKEYCSCRYVAGFEASYCREHVRQYLPLHRLDEDAQTRRVVAEGLWRRSQAQWLGPREGCRLLP